jgi:signal transduction histidine kinase
MMAETAGAKSNGSIEEIKKISGAAGELADNMSQIIRAMSSSNDSLEELILYIRRHAYEFFENSGIELQMSVPEDIPVVALTSEQRRNIFLVVKESLNNILKHSGATRANIGTVFGSEIQFSISDNGKGINAESQNRFGNGLLNMKKRMESIGGKYSLENKNGHNGNFQYTFRGQGNGHLTKVILLRIQYSRYFATDDIR